MVDANQAAQADALTRLQQQATTWAARRVAQYQQELLLLKRLNRGGLDDVAAPTQDQDELLVVQASNDLLGG